MSFPGTVPTPDRAARARPALAAVAPAALKAGQAAPAPAPSDGDTSTPALPLWDPRIAALLSLLFTPVFGAALHWWNAIELGEARLRRISWMWLGLALAFTASGLYLVSLGQLRPDSAFAASVLLSGYTVVWYAFVGRRQSRLVRRLGRPLWQPRGFGMPVLVALLLMSLPGLWTWWPAGRI